MLFSLPLGNRFVASSRAAHALAAGMPVASLPGMNRSSLLSGLAMLSFLEPVATQLPAGLSVSFPSPLRSLEASRPTVEGMVAVWRGEMRGWEIEVAVHLLDAKRWSIHEPEGAVELLRTSLRAPIGWVCSQFPREASCPSLRADLVGRAWTRLDRTQTWVGPYGASPVAGFTRGTLFGWGGDEPIGTLYALGGVLGEKVYLVKATCYPRPSPIMHEALVALLERGVRYSGSLRDPRWSDEELRARWRHWVPEAIEFRRVLRTENYAIMTSSSAGPSYGRRLEETHRVFRKLVPFRKVPGRRRLLVFLFRDQKEYDGFASRRGAQNTCGHAAADYFATWYGSPDEQIHVHEAVHQLMSNRAFLVGGGAWLQEGLADYLATPRWQRARTARLVRRDGTPTRLRDLLGLSRFEPPREPVKLGPRPRYALSALWLEFLAESDWGRGSFSRVLEEVGLIRPGNSRDTEAALILATGVDLDELEARWRGYCAER